MEHIAASADVGHGVQVDQLAQAEVQRHAADHADGAHRQRQVEAVPYRQAVLGHGAAEDRRRSGMQHRCHGQCRGDAYCHADHHQQFHRYLHPARRLMRHAIQVVRAGAKEGVVHEAQAVGHAEHAGQQRGDRHRRAHDPRAAGRDRLGKQHFLGQEAVEQRDAGHRQRGNDRQRAGERHQPAQAPQLAHVAGAGLMVDDAGGHEQRGLEGGVVEDVEHAGHHRHRRGQAEQQGDQAQVGNGRVRQQAFQVVLEDRVPGTDQQGQRADAADRIEEQVAAGQRRMQPRQQEHAGLHHGGRVQVGRDRGRRCHRVRQPEVERELRALGEDAGQHQEQGVGVQRAGADLLASGQHHVQVEAADDAADQQHATEQGQATATGDHQRHACAFAGVLAVRPEADQQERTDAGHFPEDHQQQQVARQHHAQHGAHEQQQVAVEAVRVVLLAQVVARVQHHQRADAQYQPGEHPRQPVQAQGEVQADLWQPGHQGANHLAIEHRRGQPAEDGQPAQRRQRRQPGSSRARTTGEGRNSRCHQERQGQQQGQAGEHAGNP